MKQIYTMTIMLAMAGVGSAHAGDYQCVMMAHGKSEATLCKNAGDYVLGNATGSGKLILLYPDGKFQVTATDYQDKLGMVVKLPVQKDKVVFVDPDGIVIGGIGWSESELDQLVDRNDASRLKRPFQEYAVFNGNGGGGGGSGDRVALNGNGGGGGGSGDRVAFNGNGGGGGGAGDRVAFNGNGGGGGGSGDLVAFNGNGGGGGGAGDLIAFNGNGGGGGGAGDRIAFNGNGGGGGGAGDLVGSLADDNGGFGPKLPSLLGINARCLGTLIFFSK